MPDPIVAALRLAGFALAHAAWSVEDGEILCTLAMIEIGDERELVRYDAGTIPQSVARAHDDIREHLRGGGHAALVMDGYATPDGGARTDALIVEIFGDGGRSLGTLAQPYRPFRRSRIPFVGRSSDFAVLGAPIISSELDIADAERVLLDGAREHEQAGRLFAAPAPRSRP